MSAVVETRVDALHELLRSEIASGVLRPGERLKFPFLADRYGTSIGVAREALTRLVADGYVTSRPNHGYAVVPLSIEDFEDLLRARQEVEAMVLTQSIRHGGLAWESRVVGVTHRLARTPCTTGEGAPMLSNEWSAVHSDYHRALLDACPNRRLLDTAVRLRVEAELYRRWSVSLGDEPERDVAAEHAALADAAVARDEAKAARLLVEHLEHTGRIVRAAAQAPWMVSDAGEQA